MKLSATASAATPEGPTFVANLDEAKAAVVQLSSYFAPGYRVDGSPPAIDTSVPGGALP